MSFHEADVSHLAGGESSAPVVWSAVYCRVARIAAGMRGKPGMARTQGSPVESEWGMMLVGRVRPGVPLVGRVIRRWI